jgi:hypothetical protein
MDLLVSRPFFAGIGKRKNGLKLRIRVNANGHNNIEINPVFRGML